MQTQQTPVGRNWRQPFTTVRERDDYGRSSTRYVIPGVGTVAAVTKVPRQSRWIIADWAANDSYEAFSRHNATQLAERIVRGRLAVERAAAADRDADGYVRCEDGTCGACDNNVEACSNPANPETGA